VKLYTGNGSTQTISGLGFSPDLVWIKSRSTGQDNNVFDAVRGVAGNYYTLQTNATTAEGQYGTVSALTSDGFTLSNGGGATNFLNTTYVAWTWDAGSSTVTNTSGSISSQVRANASAGFSIVTYTGTGVSGTTIGHGLGVTPEFVIVKCRSLGSTHWQVHGSYINERLELSTTGAAKTDGYTLARTSTTISPTGNASTFSYWNASGQTYVAYCFAPVAGYSSFGSYTGNGSADGPFVYTGFRPAFVLIKTASQAGNSWVIYDNKRIGYNETEQVLNPNLSGAEATYSTTGIDLLSNGFKLRGDSSWHGISGATVIYAAFAEHPFNFSRAR
jgi:hypothetical protein